MIKLQISYSLQKYLKPNILQRGISQEIPYFARVQSSFCKVSQFYKNSTVELVRFELIFVPFPFSLVPSTKACFGAIFRQIIFKIFNSFRAFFECFLGCNPSFFELINQCPPVLNFKLVSQQLIDAQVSFLIQFNAQHFWEAKCRHHSKEFCNVSPFQARRKQFCTDQFSLGNKAFIKVENLRFQTI